MSVVDDGSSSNGFRALRASTAARRKLLARRLAAELAQGRGRAVGIVAVGVGVGLTIFGVGAGAGWFFHSRDIDQVIRTITIGCLLGLSVALILSSLGHAAQSFFSAKDLWFWDSTPAPPWSRFVDRLIETAIAALPPTLALGSLALIGLMWGSGHGAAAMARAVLTVVLVGIIPLSCGVTLAHVGGAILPAGQLRRISLLVLGVLVGAALVWFRRARIEKVLTPEGAAELLEKAKTVKELGPQLSPSSLGATFVLTGDAVAFLGLSLQVAACLGVAFAAHVFLSRRARDLAVDESPVGLLRGSFREKLLTLAVRPASKELRPLLEKDLLAFVRDPAQWGQVVLLLGVGALYLVNADALREGFKQMPEIGAAVLPAMHTGLVCFIAAGLAVRFGFPQLGLEGPAIWIVDGSPMRAASVLRAKWLASLPVVAFYPTAVSLVGGFVLQLRPPLWVLTTLLCATVSAGVAAFAVGRGAMKPLFDAASLSELAFGPGALSTMMASVALAFFGSVGALFCGSAVVATESNNLPVAGGLAIAGLATLIPATVTWEMGKKSLARGAEAYIRRREDEAEREYLARTAAVERTIAVDE